MKYLSAQDILVIHAQVIDETGGSHGVRDVGLLISIVERPKTQFSGQAMYVDVFSKAAAYQGALAKYHIFVDGNKRTSISTAARFLFLNGYHLKTTNKDLEDFTLAVVVKKLEVKQIARWLRKHSRKIK